MGFKWTEVMSVGIGDIDNPLKVHCHLISLIIKSKIISDFKLEYPGRKAKRELGFLYKNMIRIRALDARTVYCPVMVVKNKSSQSHTTFGA